MRVSTRYSLASVLSVALHAAFLLWGVWGINVGLDIEPEFEFEFETVELVDPDLLQAQEPVVEPAPPLGPPPPEVPPEEEKPEEPEKQFGEKDSKISKLGPTNSTFFMLLANKKVAKLPFSAEVVEIIAPLPDFRYLIQGGGFHALKDFEYLVLASPDIRDITQTFVAVQHKISKEEVKAGIERAADRHRQVLEWQVRNGLEMANPRPKAADKEDRDPRWFVLMPDNVALYVREEFLPQIIAGPDERKGKTSGNFVANIAKMRRFTRQEPRAGLQLVLSDMRAALKSAKLPFGLEFPNDLEIMAEAAKEPELIIKLGFIERAHTKRFAQWWKEDLRKLIDSDLKVKFVAGAIYNSTLVEQQGKSVALRNSFDSDQAALILRLIGDQSRKLMRRSEAEMTKAREERDKLWELRKKGKLGPSEALSVETAAEGTKDPAAPASAPGSDAPSPKGGGRDPSG